MDFEINSVLAPKVELELYNGGDEEVEKSYNGEVYRFPAKDAHHVDREGKVYPKPGVLPVRPRGKHVLWVNFQKRFDPITPKEFVEFMVGEDGRTGAVGIRGIRLLHPDGEKSGLNDRIREEARNAYLERRYLDDLNLTSSHESENEKRKERGEPIRPPDVRVRAAYKRIAEHDQEAGIQTVMCLQCGSREASNEALEAHVKKLHPAIAASLLKKLGLGDEEEPEPPKRRGRPPGSGKKAEAVEAAVEA